MPVPPVTDVFRRRQRFVEMVRERQNVKRLIRITQASFAAITELAINCNIEELSVIHQQMFTELQTTLQTLFIADVDLDLRLRCTNAADQCRAFSETCPNPIAISSFITVNLPFNQNTVIQRVRGISIRDALVLPLHLTDLNVDLCELKPIKYLGELEWDDSLYDIKSDKITVQMNERSTNAALNHIHTFKERIYLTMVSCQFCKQLLFFGLWCKGCNYRCHYGCGIVSPSVCSGSDRELKDKELKTK